MKNQESQEQNSSASPQSNADQNLSGQVLNDYLYSAYIALVDGGRMFDDIDNDGNGFMSSEELIAYQWDHRTTGDSNTQQRESSAIDHMLDHVSKIEETANDEFGDENDGITYKDLEEYFKQTSQESRQYLSSSAHSLSAKEKPSPEDRNSRMVVRRDPSKSGERVEDRESEMILTFNESENLLCLVRGVLNRPEELDAQAIDQAIGNILGRDAYYAYIDLVDGGRAFTEIDRDHDRFLSEKELLAFEQNNPSPQLLRSVRHMRENISEIEEKSDDEWFDENDGITNRDLRRYFRDTISNTSEQIMERLDKRFREGNDGKRRSSESYLTVYDEQSDVEGMAFSDGEFSLYIHDHGRDTHLTFETYPYKLEIKTD